MTDVAAILDAIELELSDLATELDPCEPRMVIDTHLAHRIDCIAAVIADAIGISRRRPEALDMEHLAEQLADLAGAITRSRAPLSLDALAQLTQDLIESSSSPQEAPAGRRRYGLPSEKRQLRFGWF